MKTDLFFQKLDSRISGLRTKYADNEVKVSIRLLCWSLVMFFRTLVKTFFRTFFKIQSWIFAKNANKSLSIVQRNYDQKLKIAIFVSGGLGDILMYGLSIKELSKRIGCDHEIYIFADTHRDPSRIAYLNLVFKKFSFLRKVTSSLEKEYALSTYDIIVQIERCARILHCEYDKIEKKSQWLYGFCQRNEAFYEKYDKFFRNVPQYHCVVDQWSILNSKTRIQQPDQCELLKIDYNTKTFIDLDDDITTVLSKLNLHNILYITLQRGQNNNENITSGTKFWPTKHYENFVQLFKHKYPYIKIIQLGYSNELCKSIKGVDIDLIGKTTLNDITAILKHSIFHVDGDTGMVHLKKFLNGRSIAMFGPTSAKIFGYPENINLTGNGCHSWCEWISNDWGKKCLRGFDEAPCMASISPEMVMSAADKILGDLKSYSYHINTDNLKDDEVSEYIIAQKLSKSATIVDVFNKNGTHVSKQLRKIFENIIVFGKDFKFDSFSKAQDNGLQLEYGCLYNLAMPDDSCDVVIWQNNDDSITSLEYVLKELFRVLKPDGLLIISGVNFSVHELQQFGILFSKDFDRNIAYVFSKKVIPSKITANHSFQEI